MDNPTTVKQFLETFKEIISKRIDDDVHKGVDKFINKTNSENSDANLYEIISSDECYEFLKKESVANAIRIFGTSTNVNIPDVDDEEKDVIYDFVFAEYKRQYIVTYLDMRIKALKKLARNHMSSAIWRGVLYIATLILIGVTANTAITNEVVYFVLSTTAIIFNVLLMAGCVMYHTHLNNGDLEPVSGIDSISSLIKTIVAGGMVGVILMAISIYYQEYYLAYLGMATIGIFGYTTYFMSAYRYNNLHKSTQGEKL